MYQSYKIKIKVNNIQHLTDARYFAAASVDYLGFDLRGLEQEQQREELGKIESIREWILGPEIFIQVEQASEQLLETLLQYNIRHIEVSEENEWLGHSDFHWFYRGWKEELLTNVMGTLAFSDWNSQHCPPTFVRQFEKSDLNSIITGNALGVELEGTPQEKVGLKSFEFYDEVLESLEQS